MAVALDVGVVDERVATTTGMIVGGSGIGSGRLLSREVLQVFGEELWWSVFDARIRDRVVEVEAEEDAGGVADVDAAVGEWDGDTHCGWC